MSVRRFTAPLEAEFRQSFDAAGRTQRSELWVILMVTLGGFLLLHSYTLAVPDEVLQLGPYFIVGVGIPMILRRLSGAQSPIHRWSQGLFIASVYLDVTALMVLRVMCIRNGLDVVPIIVPIAMLLSLLVVQLRFGVLAPSVLIGLAAVVITELTALPITSNSLFNLVACAGLTIVPLATAYQLEQTSRSAWLNERRLKQAVDTDSLTGLPNRRALGQALDAALTNSQSVWVAMVDIDRFKSFNDQFGHPAGDRCLKSIADALRDGENPDTGFVARLAGEEFVVLWRDVDESVAADRADEVRTRIQNLGIAAPDGGVVTVSCGVSGVGAARTADISARDIVDSADGALYAAKEAGRNHTAVASTPVRPSPNRPPSPPDRAPTDGLLHAGPLSLYFPQPWEDRFRADFDAQGRPMRRNLTIGLLVVCILIFVFQTSLLRIPPEADTFGKLTLVFGLGPGIALALACVYVPRLYRYGPQLQILATTIIISAQVFERFVQLPKGYDVVPFIMPLAVLLSLCVVQIRYSLLLPSMVALLVGLEVAEVVRFPLDSNRVLTLATALVLVVVTVRFAYRVEQSRRIDWLRSIDLDELSRTDPLTHLPNRRQFTHVFHEILRTRDRPVGLLLLDIDHFKSFNDSFGHLAGDDCLITVAAAVERAAGPDDVPARLGGEEFAVIMVGGTMRELSARAELIWHSVESQRVPAAEPGTVVSASAGLAAVALPSPNSPEALADDLMRRADANLYRAKHAGRNRLVVA